MDNAFVPEFLRDGYNRSVTLKGFARQTPRGWEGKIPSDRGFRELRSIMGVWIWPAEADDMSSKLSVHDRKEADDKHEL